MTEQLRWRGADYVVLTGGEPVRVGGQIFFPGLRYTATSAVVQAHPALFQAVMPDDTTEEPEEAPEPLERLGDPEE